VFGAWHVDDGMEGDHRVEGLRCEGRLGHIRLEEGAFGDVLSGEFQLPGRDVHARNSEVPVGEPARCRHASAAAQVQHGGLRWQEGGKIFQGPERERVVRVLGGEILLGYAIVPRLDGALVGVVVQRAVTPPSTTMHAPIVDADSSEAR
jgi:hypothetical protein